MRVGSRTTGVLIPVRSQWRRHTASEITHEEVRAISSKLSSVVTWCNASLPPNMTIVSVMENVMPRARSERNEAGRTKTERWRKRRLAVGRPESSIIDRAVAASLAAHFRMDVEMDTDRELYHRILRGATRLLVDRGFQKAETNLAMVQRLTRRIDLYSLTDIAVGRDVENHFSPLLPSSESEV